MCCVLYVGVHVAISVFLCAALNFFSSMLSFENNKTNGLTFSQGLEVVLEYPPWNFFQLLSVLVAGGCVSQHYPYHRWSFDLFLDDFFPRQKCCERQRTSLAEPPKVGRQEMYGEISSPKLIFRNRFS